MSSDIINLTVSTTYAEWIPPVYNIVELYGGYLASALVGLYTGIMMLISLIDDSVNREVAFALINQC